MKFFNIIKDLLFPPKCIYCGADLPPDTRPFICGECMKHLPFDKIRCCKCGCEIVFLPGHIPVCPTCKSAGRNYDCAVSAAYYTGNVRNAILKYKFSYQSYMAEHLSYFLINILKKLNINSSNIDFITFVPCGKYQKRRRGFENAGLLAEAVSKRLKIPYCDHVLEKIKTTKTQSTLPLNKRAENIRGAFKVTDKKYVKGKRILLIDDIFTTGATVMEISRQLKRAGAEYVMAATATLTKIDSSGKIDSGRQ